MNEWEWQLLEDKAPLDSIWLSENAHLRRGDRIRLHPLPGGDVMDLALAGNRATLALKPIHELIGTRGILADFKAKGYEVEGP